MVALFTFILLLAVLYIAGRQRGKFEAILIFDSLKYWKGNKYSREMFFNGSKDTNNDGKVSYWEKTFPRDGGHRTKLYEVILLSQAFCLVAIFMVKSVIWISKLPGVPGSHWKIVNLWFHIPIIFLPIFFLIYSLGFRHAINKYRMLPTRAEVHKDFEYFI